MEQIFVSTSTVVLFYVTTYFLYISHTLWSYTFDLGFTNRIRKARPETIKALTVVRRTFPHVARSQFRRVEIDRFSPLIKTIKLNFHSLYFYWCAGSTWPILYHYFFFFLEQFENNLISIYFERDWTFFQMCIKIYFLILCNKSSEFLGQNN